MNKTIILISSFLLLLKFPSVPVETSSNFISQASSKQSYCQIEPERGEFLSTQQMQTLASQITVKVTGDNNGGSGTILGKQGNYYLVLTNFHVVRGVNKINLKTFDGNTYPAEIVSQSKFKKSDLALLKFQTNQNYCVPPIAESIINTTGLPVMAAGYSAEKGEIVFRPGEVKQIPGQALKEGYQIGYTSDVEQGMSGGAIISSDGTLIGINGRSAYPILNTGYVYENGKKPTDAEIQKMRKVSWGIPVSTVLAQVNTNILTAYSLPLPEAIIGTPPLMLTGWLGELEKKAKQFTVKIDSTSGGNGSGIIIAKSGDTYTVLTAAHVVCEKKPGTKPCRNYSYEIIAPDGKKYSVEKSTIKTEEGVDLGVLKFKSQQSYRVATLADYNPNRDDYMFTAGYPKLGNESPWRFTPGRIFDKEQGLLVTRQSDFQSDTSGKLQTASSLTGGYELVYTSITYGGMSGGPVLDSLGRVIGIHGRAEGEQAIDEKTQDCGVNYGCKVQLGYSLGIPISTFLGLTKRFGVQAQKVENKKAPQLTAQKVKSIQEAVLSAKVDTGNAKASQWLERGNQLWRLRRYKEAIKAYDEAIKQKPAFVYLAYYGKALALGKLGKGKEGLAALKQAVELKKDFVAAWQTLSVVYKELKQPENALVTIDKAIQLQPQNPNLYNEKSVALSRLKRYPEAQSAINKAIKLAPRSAFYANRGTLYAQQKESDLALADYNEAIRINPNFSMVYNNRGIIYREQKKWELALAGYNKVIQINPNDGYAYNNRGNLYKDWKKWDLALDDYNKAIKINPNDAGAYNNRGNLYKDWKKWELALVDYNEAIRINPKFAIAYYNRGNLYKNWKKWELALADYNKAIQINPNDGDAYNNRGIIYTVQKKWELALVDYNKAIQINPNNAIAYNNRGNLYKDWKKWDLAEADFSKAIQINPNYASAYNSRGNFYAEQKKWDLAEADFSKAIRIDPNYAINYILRGMFYYRTGDKQRAIQDLQQAAQLLQVQGNTVAYKQVMDLLKKLQE